MILLSSYIVLHVCDDTVESRSWKAELDSDVYGAVSDKHVQSVQEMPSLIQVCTVLSQISMCSQYRKAELDSGVYGAVPDKHVKSVQEGRA
ncbi:hypothetical protein DPMN_116193 [Dreissena polymorpha]|uniref:Uncharacterized protein n=1 Tax=Dreissena polymorpha TaxID=45954 RepID=A0A9D4KNH7_DREPO|nr:hypothetical protein DPMN_116193 [Dreissena polymorpha]